MKGEKTFLDQLIVVGRPSARLHGVGSSDISSSNGVECKQKRLLVEGRITRLKKLPYEDTITISDLHHVSKAPLTMSIKDVFNDIPSQIQKQILAPQSKFLSARSPLIRHSKRSSSGELHQLANFLSNARQQPQGLPCFQKYLQSTPSVEANLSDIFATPKIPFDNDSCIPNSLMSFNSYRTNHAQISTRHTIHQDIHNKVKGKEDTSTNFLTPSSHRVLKDLMKSARPSILTTRPFKISQLPPQQHSEGKGQLILAVPPSKLSGPRLNGVSHASQLESLDTAEVACASHRSRSTSKSIFSPQYQEKQPQQFQLQLHNNHKGQTRRRIPSDNQDAAMQFSQNIPLIGGVRSCMESLSPSSVNPSFTAKEVKTMTPVGDLDAAVMTILQQHGVCRRERKQKKQVKLIGGGAGCNGGSDINEESTERSAKQLSTLSGDSPLPQSSRVSKRTEDSKPESCSASITQQYEGTTVDQQTTLQNQMLQKTKRQLQRECSSSISPLVINRVNPCSLSPLSKFSFLPIIMTTSDKGGVGCGECASKQQLLLPSGSPLSNSRLDRCRHDQQQAANKYFECSDRKGSIDQTQRRRRGGRRRGGATRIPSTQRSLSPLCDQNDHHSRRFLTEIGGTHKGINAIANHLFIGGENIITVHQQIDGLKISSPLIIPARLQARRFMSLHTSRRGGCGFDVGSHSALNRSDFAVGWDTTTVADSQLLLDIDGLEYYAMRERHREPHQYS